MRHSTIGDESTEERSFWEHPCHADGRIFAPIQHASGDFALANGLRAQHYFSHKPSKGYDDYYEKVRTYARVISDQARIIDPSVDARTWKVARWADDPTPLVYADTASTRAGILAINERASNLRVAIVGLGGTGGYVLDFMARTYVLEIHLFDGDYLRQHNAFRTPGAISAATLGRHLFKVDRLAEHYAHFRRGIVPHAQMIDESNVHLLEDFDYVFLCIDRGPARALIIDRLEKSQAVLIDCGMGMGVTPSSMQLWGTVRVTVSAPHSRAEAARTMPLADRDDELYRSNIQICEMNALNAAMAVIRWKRLVGMFVDDREEVEATYNTGLNQMNNKSVHA